MQFAPVQPVQDKGIHLDREGGMSDSDALLIGGLKEAVTTLKEANSRLSADIERLNLKMDAIEKLLSEIKGGSKVIIWVGSLVSGGLGAAAIKFLPFLFVKG